MGEYAEMYIESAFNDYFDKINGINKYDSFNDQVMIDGWDNDDMEIPNFTSQLQSKKCWELQLILKETDKSFLIVTKKTNRKYWVSKKLSQIKGDFIFIEKWYASKLVPVPF